MLNPNNRMRYRRYAPLLGDGEFSAHFLVGGKCLLLYTNQRFRQFDRGYLLMLVGRAQSSGESGVCGNRCGCGGVVGGELPRGDRSHAAVDSEGVGGTAGIGGKVEASIAGGFEHGGEAIALALKGRLPVAVVMAW